MFQQVAIDRGVDQLGCDAVVEFRGKLSCSLPESAAAGEAQTAADSSIFSVDHVHPHSDREKELVVLYADAESESFGKLHSQILDLVRLGKVTYVFRHFLPNRSRQKARMSGKLLAVNSHFSEFWVNDAMVIFFGQAYQGRKAYNFLKEGHIKMYI